MPALGFGVFQSSSAKSSVSEALRAGYRHIDSAQYYRNEAQVGQAVRESELSREDVFLTSKVLSYGAGYQGVHSAVVESLKRFKFEYLDLFLLHDPNGGKRHRLASWKALLELKAAGKLRNTGVSNFGVKHLQEIKDAGMELPSVNQIELHPLCQQRPIVEFCLANDIVVQAYSPLLQGNLSHPMFSQIAEKHNKTPAQVVLRWSLQKGFVPVTQE
ncbi:NADP-dependent oxidoreductase domain-containing protein [Flagelloscypha sp. PMI_526]|nr:NADP-dependent oxidoreductase domain-containing protein [Flagelloscypha sp. PMI_526]